MGYGNTFLGAMALLSSSVIATMGAGISSAYAASSYVQVAQYTYEYGPNNKVYRIDENARRNNELYGYEDQRIRQDRRKIRRQIRRENRARKRARARAARQRLYDVRERERRRAYGGYIQRYDGYGNPVPSRIVRPFIQPNAQPRKTRPRVKLVYVPIPREKPYHLIAQAPVKSGQQTSTPKIIKTATAPKVVPQEPSPKEMVKPATEVTSLPKIEIETLPNPNSTAPKITKKAPREIKQAEIKPVKSKTVEQNKSTPKAVKTEKSQKKIKYTTFAETLRKIRERNKAEQQKSTQEAQKTQQKSAEEPTKITAVKKAEIKKPAIKKLASLEPKNKPQIKKPIIKETLESKPAANQISCKKAREIIIDYGFSEVKEITCKGKDYDFNAKRDGKPFKITLSALSGELKKVLRQK